VTGRTPSFEEPTLDIDVLPVRGRAAALLAGTGARAIGRYELRREIGRGNMGVVYEAYDPRLERTVALKTIRLGFDASPEELEAFEWRFVGEARIAARLSHPGIVTIHDVGQDPGTGDLYIAMEHLVGATLAETLSSGFAFPWREALRVTREVALALHYAHERGVVHRDLKPANVMVLATGQPKIMDFGVARLQDGGVHLTAAGQSVGTPLYASPEQALGEAVDGRADIFSLGAVAYTLLTGSPAFAADSVAGVIARVIGAEPAPPSSLVGHIPPAVDRVIARALAKSPAARYPNGAEFAAAIDAVLGRTAEPAAGPVLPGKVDDTLAAPGRDAALRSHARRRLPTPGRRASAIAVLAALAVAAAVALSRYGPIAAPGAAAAGLLQPSRPPAVEKGAVAVRFERLPRDASIRVWVDRVLVSDGRPREAADGKAAVALLGPEAAEALGVDAGGHDVEVEVAWAGRRLRSRVWGQVRAGATRRLRASVGGLLRKSLSLEWE